jgi:hypothetical protein
VVEVGCSVGVAALAEKKPSKLVVPEVVAVARVVVTRAISSSVVTGSAVVTVSGTIPVGVVVVGTCPGIISLFDVVDISGGEAVPRGPVDRGSLVGFIRPLPAVVEAISGAEGEVVFPNTAVLIGAAVKSSSFTCIAAAVVASSTGNVGASSVAEGVVVSGIAARPSGRGCPSAVTGSVAVAASPAESVVLSRTPSVIC